MPASLSIGCFGWTAARPVIMASFGGADIGLEQPASYHNRSWRLHNRPSATAKLDAALYPMVQVLLTYVSVTCAAALRSANVSRDFSTGVYSITFHNSMARWAEWMLKRFFLYGLPLYLVLVEQCVRFLLHFAPGKPEEMSTAAAGTSIAVAGISLLFPVIVPKPINQPLTPRLQRLVNTKNLAFVNKSDQKLIGSALFFLFFTTGLWGYSLWLSHIFSDTSWYSLNSPFIIGLINYAIGVVHTELKDIV